MDERFVKDSHRRDIQPLLGDEGPSPPSSSGAALGASTRGNKMHISSRSTERYPEDKPLSHPQKWALTLLAARASLGTALLPLAVRLPSSMVDVNEWLACQVYDIFNESTVVWGFVRDVCSCRRLTAGENPSQKAGDPQCVRLFLFSGWGVVCVQWSHHARENLQSASGLILACVRRLCICLSFSLVAATEPSAPARDHIRATLKKCRSILKDPRIFACQPGQDFPRNFPSFVSHILVQLLQMYCHIYRQHFDWLLETDTVAHVNCCFKHALFFGAEFRLVKLEDVAPIRASSTHSTQGLRGVLLRLYGSSNLGFVERRLEMPSREKGCRELSIRQASLFRPSLQHASLGNWEMGALIPSSHRRRGCRGNLEMMRAVPERYVMHAEERFSKRQ
ncbi:mob1 phocein family domain-containing protein [Cyclospora cayetanensis]|uniref:Mob1 phocein family domain-containing protein n=1 Tax=Cyclospora cayetanensis TaxID=88456 RepID=A0A1D3CXW0_9EIME|nr:mob1 phocein family domain-containing protein [Cyclospora cayetanensis]